MRPGDTVRVHPHGRPDLSATGAVALISSNGRSIALAFADKPPFVGREGFMVHPQHGVIMLACREELYGAPWGPWVEVIGGGHYEIDKLGGP